MAGVFAAGLLHDIGRAALLQVVPERYARIDPGLTGVDLLSAEEEQLGLTHAEAGYELATHWALPEQITAAIRFHHHPDRAPEMKEIVAIVSLADIIVHAREKTARLFENCTDTLTLLDLDVEAATTILEDYFAGPDDDSSSFFFVAQPPDEEEQCEGASREA